MLITCCFGKDFNLSKFALEIESETAIKEILKFYDAYICKLCLRTFYHSESGKITMQVDEELKGQIYTEMMKAILKFEIRVK